MGYCISTTLNTHQNNTRSKKTEVSVRLIKQVPRQVMVYAQMEICV